MRIAEKYGQRNYFFYINCWHPGDDVTPNLTNGEKKFRLEDSAAESKDA